MSSQGTAFFYGDRMQSMSSNYNPTIERGESMVRESVRVGVLMDCSEDVNPHGMALDTENFDYDDEVPVEKPEYEEIKTNVLGCWDTRGLAQAVRYQLVFQNIDFKEQVYTQE